MQNTEPYVAAALLCENAQFGKDDSVSVTRVIDTFWVPDDVLDKFKAQPSAGPPGVRFYLYVALKSGDVKGKSTVTLNIRHPDGSVRKDAGKWPVRLNGGVHGMQVVLETNFLFREFGTYWFDVNWEGRLRRRYGRPRP